MATKTSNAPSRTISSSDQLPSWASVVIVGAGVAGVALAHALTVIHGKKDVVVIDRGTLFTTGGSSSHAPGGCLVLHPTSETLTKAAKETVQLFAELGAYYGVDEFILARTQERLEYLQEEAKIAKKVGLASVEMVAPEEVKRRFPLIDDKVLKGALLYPKETGIGRAAAVRAVNKMAEEAARTGGARFFGHCEVSNLLVSSSSKRKVEGVQLNDGRIVRADQVSICAGAWSIELLERIGVTNVPVVNVEHQWVLTDPLPELSQFAPSPPLPLHSSLEHQTMPTNLPAIFDSDASVYFSQYGDRLGFGNYDHRALLVDSNAELRRHANAEFPFNPLLFRRAKANIEQLIPVLASSKALDRPARAFHGLMSFAPDGFPVVGPIESVEGLWLSVGIWVMYSVGLGRLLADWMESGREKPPTDQWKEILKLAPNDKTRWEKFVPSTRDPNTRQAIAQSYETRSAIPSDHNSSSSINKQNQEGQQRSKL